jgi:hypothetical protein
MMASINSLCLPLIASNCLGLARSLREAREALKAGKTDAEAAIEREKAKQREAATSQKVRCDERSRQREQRRPQRRAVMSARRCSARSPSPALACKCSPQRAPPLHSPQERSTLLREIAELKADRKDAAAREAAALERARLHRAAMEKLKTDKDAESARADAAEAHARKALEMTETALERGEVLAFRHASLSACLSLSAVDEPLTGARPCRRWQAGPKACGRRPSRTSPPLWRPSRPVRARSDCL